MGEVMELSRLDLTYISNAFNQEGYVYDFSNDSFSKFTEESIGECIQEKYHLSKGKSLELFFADKNVDIAKKIKMLKDLIEYEDIFVAKRGNEFWEMKNVDIEKHNIALQKCREILNKLSEADIITETEKIQEKGLKDLLEEAQDYFRKDKQIATEKMWDAFERLKTYYSDLDKKHSADKIIEDMSHNDANYIHLFKEEFNTLREIGNNYRIRHHETDKIDIIDNNYYIYLYYRCLALIDLAKKYLI